MVKNQKRDSGGNMETSRYIKASLGGIIGGILFSLPWLLIYTFSPISLPFFAFLIPTGVDQGYRKLKGRVNRKLTKFIIGISVFVFLLIYLVYFPLILGSNIFNFAYWQSMLKELIISLVSLIAGIYKVNEDILYEIGLRY